MKNKKIIPYINGDLKGECLEEFSNIKISEIPFYTLFKNPSPKIDLVKCSHFRRVVCFKWDKKSGIVEKTNENSVTIYIKQSRVRGLKKKIGKLFFKSQGKHGWELAWRLLDIGIPTAMPLIWAEGKLPNEEYSSYLATMGIENAKTMREFFKSNCDYKLLLEILISAADMICKIHSANFCHDDLCTKNILVNKKSKSADIQKNDYELFLIDLDSGKFAKQLNFYKKSNNLYQFLSSLPKKLRRKNIALRFLIQYINNAFPELKHHERKKMLKKLIFYFKLISFFKFKKINFLN